MVKDWVARKILANLIRTYGDELVLSCSFGAPEGMMLLDMLSKTGHMFTVCTIDTGRLPQATYNLIDKAQEKYKFNLSIIYPDFNTVLDMIKKKGMNSFYLSEENRLECCEIRKVVPFKKYLQENNIRAVVTGLRKDQSEFRQNIKFLEVDKYDNCAKFNPILDWTRQEVMEYINEHKVPINELHHEGYESVGCAPCSRPGKGREGRWWWENDEVKECGLHIDGSGI